MTKRSIDHFRIAIWVWTILSAFKMNAKNIDIISIIMNFIATFAFPMHLVVAIFSFETPLENLQNLFITVTSFATSIKFLLNVSQLHHFMAIKEILNELDGRVKSKDQLQYFQRLSKQLRVVNIVFIIIYASCAINSELSFMFRSERSLPFPSWFALDWKTSFLSYLIALIFQFLSITIQVLQNFVNDLFPPLALCLIAGHCKLLTLRVSNIGWTSISIHHQRRSKVNTDDDEEELLNCIRDQQNIYKLIDLTLKMISYPMLVQFVATAIVTGTSLFALIFFTNGMQERINYISFLIALGLQIFPVCFYGTQVVELFVELKYAVFCSNWVSQGPVYRKNMIIFAERTQRAPDLLAGGMIPIDLTTFLANCKAAYSFFTLIQNTR